MSHHSSHPARRGFTLVELVIVMTMTMVISTAFYTFFKTNLFTYLDLQKDASGFTDLATQSHRIGNIVRGSTSVVAAGNNELTLYAYFYPTDTYVSLVRYYLNGDATVLYADVTPMTADPPIGTPITSDKKTHTIINNFKQTDGVNLFGYLDSAGDPLNVPITDLHTIKGVRINLAVAVAEGNTNQVMTLQVSLRNRKTNL